MAEAPDEAVMSARARALLDQGIRLSELDRAAEALVAEQEAVTIYRRLAAIEPGTFRPLLADALASIGVTFSELDRPADALAAEHEAVSIRRELAAADPDTHRADLAKALASMGATLSALDRWAEALPVEEEAVDILWQGWRPIPRATFPTSPRL
ncbi:tetratricopeptide repeat protein [Nonomuraea thailandensis]